MFGISWVTNCENFSTKIMSHNSRRQLWDSCAAARGMRATLLHSRLILFYLIFIFFSRSNPGCEAQVRPEQPQCRGRPRGGAVGPGADPALDPSRASIPSSRRESRAARRLPVSALPPAAGLSGGSSAPCRHPERPPRLGHRVENGDASLPASVANLA